MIDKVDDTIAETLAALKRPQNAPDRQAYALQLHALVELRAQLIGQPVLPAPPMPWELR